IPDPGAGLATLNALSGMSIDRLDHRQALLSKLSQLSPSELKDSPKAADYLRMMAEARAMMDSPVKNAFNYKTAESPETLAAYEPRINPSQLRDTTYYYGNRFAHGLLLARRLLESGARF